MMTMPLVGFLLMKYRPRWLIIFGLCVVATSLFFMSGFDLNIDFKTAMFSRVIQAGGLGFLFVPISTAAFLFISKEKYTNGSGLFNLSRNIGGNLDAFKKLIKRNTKLVWVETPTNPMLKLVDLRGLSKITKEAGVLLAVDNTFASPYLQRPLRLGADIIVHSTTKYIAGHSDLIGGAVVVNDKKLYQQLKYYQNATGATPGPWDCWLTIRGLRTLSLRMREHSENALYLAKVLENNEQVKKVIYPGLPSHPQHELAKQQMSGFGGMISIELRGGACGGGGELGGKGR